MGADYETTKNAIKDYEKNRQDAHHQGNIADAYSLSYKLYASFPNNKLVNNNVMVDSYLKGFHNRGDKSKSKYYLELSITVAKRFLKLTEDIEEQCRCINNISVCNKLLGNEEKADFIQCNLDAVLYMLHRMIYVYATVGDLTKQERIKALEKIPRIFEIVFEDEDYGFYHVFISRVFAELARLNEDSDERAVAYVKKAAEHARLYDYLPAQMHTSVLFKGQNILSDQFAKANTQTHSQRIADLLSNDIFKDVLI